MEAVRDRSMMNLVAVSMGQYENAWSSAFTKGPVSCGCFPCLPYPAPTALIHFTEKAGLEQFVAGPSSSVSFVPGSHANHISGNHSGDNMGCDIEYPHVVLKDSEA